MFDFLRSLAGARPEKHRKKEGQIDILESPLLQLDSHDAFTFREACEGIQVLGLSGAGKSSGPAKTIARSFLRHFDGGLSLTVKADECEHWKRMAQETGTLHRLKVLGVDGSERFNPFDHESRRPGSGSGLVENILSLLMAAVEITNHTNKTGSNDAYWENAMRQLLRHAIALVQAATGGVHLDDVHAVITSAPLSVSELNDPHWQERSACFTCLNTVHDKAERGEMTPSDLLDWYLTRDFWIHEYPHLSEKTRSVILSVWTSVGDALLRSPLRELLCTKSTIIPEMTFAGMVWVLDLPVHHFGRVGQMAQAIIKMAWQKAAERRPIQPDTKPVFLWCDESQYFVHGDHDPKFQTTARSSRVATVYLTQSLSNYEAMGLSKTQVSSLMTNLSTKIFCNNACPETNHWAAEMIARAPVMKGSWNTARNHGHDESPSGSGGTSFSEHFEYQVTPLNMTLLKTGGPKMILRWNRSFLNPGEFLKRPEKPFST